MSDLTSSIHTYLTTSAASGFAGRAIEMRAHWRGNDNLLWRVNAGRDTAVVKLFLDAGQARSRRQYAAQEKFSPYGLAPEPLWVDRYPEGLSRQVLVYRWREGASIVLDDIEHVESLADAIAEVHAAPADDVLRVSPNPLNLAYFWRILTGSFVPDAGWLESQQARTLHAWFVEATARAQQSVEAAHTAVKNSIPTPVHGDLSAENSLLDRGRTLFLDWEMSGLGDPALEIAHFLHVERGQLRGAMAGHFLNYYVAHTGDRTIPVRVALYTPLLHLRDVTFLLDGLRNISPAERSTPEYADSEQFLANALRGAVEEAGKTLDIACDNQAELSSDIETIVRRTNA